MAFNANDGLEDGRLSWRAQCAAVNKRSRPIADPVHAVPAEPRTITTECPSSAGAGGAPPTMAGARPGSCEPAIPAATVSKRVAKHLPPHRPAALNRIVFAHFARPILTLVAKNTA